MSEAMNGSAPILPKMAIINPVVDLLEKVLADARAGKWAAVAVICANQQGAVLTAYAGDRRGDLHLGSALLSNGLLAEIANPKQTVAPKILRPMVG
jgi:hypothetical protein